MTSRFTAGLAAGLLVAGLALPAFAQSLTYGSGGLERANFNARGVKPMLSAVSKATEGRVKFRSLFGGTVVKLDTTLQGIRDGVVDSGFVITSFHPSELPHLSMLGEMSALSTDAHASAGAANEILRKHCTACQEDIAKQSQHAVFSWSTSPMSMVCVADIKDSSELAGKRVSVISSGDSRWAVALGMSPTRTAISDLASSLQLGRSDCAIVPINWIRSYGLLDLAKSVITLPQGVGAAAIPLSISTKAWQALSEADRAAIESTIADNLYTWLQDAYLDADADVRKQTESKIRYIDQDDAMQAKWQAYQASEIDALIELAKRRNLPDAEKFVREAAEVFRRWHEQHLPVFKGKPEVYAEIFRREVLGQ